MNDDKSTLEIMDDLYQKWIEAKDYIVFKELSSHLKTLISNVTYSISADKSSEIIEEVINSVYLDLVVLLSQAKIEKIYGLPNYIRSTVQYYYSIGMSSGDRELCIYSEEDRGKFINDVKNLLSPYNISIQMAALKLSRRSNCKRLGSEVSYYLRILSYDKFKIVVDLAKAIRDRTSQLYVSVSPVRSDIKANSITFRNILSTLELPESFIMLSAICGVDNAIEISRYFGGHKLDIATIESIENKSHNTIKGVNAALVLKVIDYLNDKYLAKLDKIVDTSLEDTDISKVLTALTAVSNNVGVILRKIRK